MFLKQVFCIVVNIKPNSFNLLIILVESRNNIPITYFRQSAASNSQNASKPRRGPPKYGSQAQPGPSTANVDRDRYENFFYLKNIGLCYLIQTLITEMKSSYFDWF